MAWRNLWRQRGRSSIMLSVIAFTFGMMLMTMGMGDFMHSQMAQSAVDGAGGSVLVHAEGYWASQGAELVIREPDPLIAEAEQLEGTRLVVPRVRVYGLLNSARGAAGVSLMGIVPEKEAALEDYSRFVVEGDYLLGDVADPLVLGRGVVEELELELGDKVVLTATDPQGELVRALFHLSGIVETGVDSIDDVLAMTSLRKAQEALALGDAVHQLGVVLDDDARRFAVRDVLRERLGPKAEDLGEQAKRPSAQKLELLTWDEAMPEMLGFIEIDDAFFYVFALAIFVVVAFGVANTFLMSVKQRVRELGLLAALGLRPAQVARLVLFETLLLASLSLLIGYAIGLAGHLLLLHYGIDMKSFYDADMEVSGVALVDTMLHSQLTVSKWLNAGLVLLVGLMLSALYPALMASRLDPVEAMRSFD
jgi:ABC-type lipoprotein release transport system permease subunit